MDKLETGKERVKKICDVLKRETLEPALREAEEIVIHARAEADLLIDKAKKKAAKLVEEAQADIDRKSAVFQASLAQACRQALDTLKELIERQLFRPKLAELIAAATADPKLLAQLVTVIIKAVEKEGMGADLTVIVPSAIPARTINELIGKEILEKLREKSVVLGPIKGGVEVKLHKDQITIDITDKALKELVGGYIRKDFRALLYGE